MAQTGGDMLQGIVEVDETYIGGKGANKIINGYRA
ncbi:transposase [Candidatus Roizmanbacteria bacterium]|nr:transposase [Candidatus Roizmanbacteria bacterium]